MSAEPRRVTKTEVWVGWENQVVNGTYPLRRFLGGSHHSAVFLTEYRPERVANAAIKLVPADTLETEAQLVQWGTAATLTHPHLLRIFDVGRCHIGGRVFLFVVMEYADQTLAQILPRRALTPDETREMLLPTLSALGFLHRNKLVQGQLKPTNLLVVGDQLKLASDTIRSIGHLSSGILRASLYDPPELKDGEIAPAGDIWGLGVTLVEALTQHPPGWPDARSETVSLAASIPPLFVDTVRRCLNRTPSNRPTAAELEGQFNPAVHTHPITVVAAEEPVYEVATVSTAEPTTSPMRAASGGGVLVLAVAAVLVLGLAVWVSRTIFISQFEVPAASGVADRAGAGAGKHGGTAGTAASGSRAGAGNHGAPAGTAAAQAGGQYVARDVASSRAAARSGDEVPVGNGPAANPSVEYGSAGATAADGRSPDVGGTGTASSEVGSGAVGLAGATRADAGQSASGTVSAARDSSTAGLRERYAPGATTRDVPVPADPTLNSPQPAASALGQTLAAAPTSAAGLAPAAPPEVLGSVLHQKLPDVPRAIREQIRGHVNVAVRVLVDPSGDVVGEFIENAGPSRYFSRLAGDAGTEWKFVPTEQHGSRVWMLRFEFTRMGATVRMVGTQ